MATAYSSLAFSVSPCTKPTRKKNQEDDDETYVLTLAPFTRPPKISFGTVKVNESVEKSLMIINPQEFPMELNVTNTELNINNIKISIDKGETVALKLKWEPTKPDNYRYTINFEVLNSLKLKFVVHAYGVCEKIDPKKKPPIKRAPFKVLQPMKTKKEEEKAAPIQPQPPVQAPNQEKTILMRSNQENSKPKLVVEMHNQTRVVEKPKRVASALMYDDDFYRESNDFNCTTGNHLLDVTTTTTSTMPLTGLGGPVHSINSTHIIDRRQTTVISTPKLNMYRSMDSINVTSNLTTSSITQNMTLGMKTPSLIQRSSSMHSIYMEQTIIKDEEEANVTSGPEEAVETTMIQRAPPPTNPFLVTIKKKQEQPNSPGTPKLSDYLRRTPRAAHTCARDWLQAHEHDRTAKYAIMCQRAYRMKRFRLRLRMLKLTLEQTRAALVVQRQWRIKVFRRHMSRMRRAAIVIQRWYRRVRADRQRAEAERHIWLERIALFTRVVAARRIQRWYRQIRLRRAELERKRLHAVILVQSQWRMVVAKQRYRAKLNAIHTIQRWYRQKRAKRIENERRRAEFERKRLHAVILVQSQWRMVVAKRRYHAKLNAIHTIQRWYRQKRARRIENERRRVEYERRRLEAAVVVVQSRWRMIVARRQYRFMLKSSILIQTWYRGRLARQQLAYKRKLVAAAVVIQSRWKMIRQRRIYVRMLWATKLIQTLYRGMSARRRLAQTKRKIKAVIVIQSQWRMILARRRFRTILRSTRLIQKWYRTQRDRRKHVSATRIQATWRGYIARKRYLADKRLRQQQQQQQQQKNQQNRTTQQYQVTTRRSTVDQSSSSSRTLGARIKNALQVLTCPTSTAGGGDNSIPLSSIIYSLSDLHTVTRLSPECCEIFVRESATDILFGFIANCNRSVPHMDMIKLCLDILLNLARYYKTVTHICTVSSAFPTLLNLLHAYQLSNSAIFMNVCVIMLLLHRHACLGESEMSSVGGRDKLSCKLVSMHLALEKRRLAMSKSGNPLSSKKHVYSLEPEWQLSRTCQTIELVDSLSALEVLMAELGMLHTSAVAATTSASASSLVSSSARKMASASASSTGVARRDPAAVAAAAQTPVRATAGYSHIRRVVPTATSTVQQAKTVRKMDYATSTTTVEINENTIISHPEHHGSNNTSVLSNVTIRSVSGFFSDEPHLNSTRCRHS